MPSWTEFSPSRGPFCKLPHLFKTMGTPTCTMSTSKAKAMSSKEPLLHCTPSSLGITTVQHPRMTATRDGGICQPGGFQRRHAMPVDFCNLLCIATYLSSVCQQLGVKTPKEMHTAILGYFGRTLYSGDASCQRPSVESTTEGALS